MRATAIADNDSVAAQAPKQMQVRSTDRACAPCALVILRFFILGIVPGEKFADNYWQLVALRRVMVHAEESHVE